MQEKKKMILAFLGKPQDIQATANLLVQEVRERIASHPEAPIILITQTGWNSWVRVDNPEVKAAMCCGHFSPKKECSYIIYANGKSAEHQEILKKFSQHGQMPAETYDKDGSMIT